MLISGALGIFRKDLVINAGGYRTQSIGEDMEMTVRLRKYLYERKMPHRVAYIPEPLLWTEVPPSVKVMDRQRTRWMHGLIDTLRLHRNLFFNPKYGISCMVSYPYFLFFEWFAPFVEVLALFFSELTFHVYERKRDVWRLFVISFTEIFLYHPRIVYWSLKGNWMYLRGKNSWGNMSRQGFKKH